MEDMDDRIPDNKSTQTWDYRILGDPEIDIIWFL